MQDDLLDALAPFVVHGTIDPKRVAIMGGSYGGFATLVGLEQTPDRFACGVDIAGPTNWADLITEAARHLTGQAAMVKYYAGNPADGAERRVMDERSPVRNFDRIRAPLLVLHGAKDPRVAVGQSRRLVESMKDRELPVEYVEYPDEGHQFDAPHNLLDACARIEEFLARHLHGRFEPR